MAKLTGCLLITAAILVGIKWWIKNSDIMIKAFTTLFKLNQASNKIASSDRIYLREITENDATFMFDLMNQKNWLAYIGDKGITSLADAQAHIKVGPKRSYKVNGFGPYMIVDIDSDESIGICGLLKRSYLDSPDLGFAISERFYRQGYGFEAAKLTLQIANKLVAANYIYATVNINNEGSIQLLHKLGFTIQQSDRLRLLGSDADDLYLYKIDISKHGAS